MQQNPICLLLLFFWVSTVFGVNGLQKDNSGDTCSYRFKNDTGAPITLQTSPITTEKFKAASRDSLPCTTMCYTAESCVKEDHKNYDWISGLSCNITGTNFENCTFDCCRSGVTRLTGCSWLPLPELPDKNSQNGTVIRQLNWTKIPMTIEICNATHVDNIICPVDPRNLPIQLKPPSAQLSVAQLAAAAQLASVVAANPAALGLLGEIGLNGLIGLEALSQLNVAALSPASVAAIAAQISPAAVASLATPANLALLQQLGLNGLLVTTIPTTLFTTTTMITTTTALQTTTTGTTTTAASTTTTTGTGTTTTTTKICKNYGVGCRVTADCCNSTESTFRFIPTCFAHPGGGLWCDCTLGGDPCNGFGPCCTGLPCNTAGNCPTGIANDFCYIGRASHCVAPLVCTVDPEVTAIYSTNGGKCLGTPIP